MSRGSRPSRAGPRWSRRAGITPSDIRACEIYDCYTYTVLVTLEDYGFCAKGEAAKLLEDGETSLGGRIPVNPSGGLLAKGHPVGATGVSQVYELAKQLRGEAAKEGRQVKNPKHGLAVNFGGFGNNVVTTICSALPRGSKA